MSDASAPQPAPNFESAMAELERVVEDLEGGELSLDESLARYELGVRRLTECRKILASIEGRIEILRRTADGGLTAEPFDPKAGRAT